MGFCVEYLFCGVVHNVVFSFAITLEREREKERERERERERASYGT